MRFISVDFLAADYPQLTPYNYAGNKPITHFDIDGMQSTGDEKQGGSSGGNASGEASGKKQETDTIKPGGSAGTPSTQESNTKSKLESKEPIAKEPETSFLEDWNKAVSDFNTEFTKDINKVIDDPIGAINDFAKGTVQFLSDITYISNLTGNENQITKAGNEIASKVQSLPEQSRAEQIKFGLDAAKIIGTAIVAKKIAGSMGKPSVSVATKGVLSRTERLSMFKNGLSNAANPKNPNEALSLINKTLDGIELKHAGVNDRMFGILDNKYVTLNSNGSMTALTTGHRIEIQSNGMFSIFERKTGNLFFSK